LLIAEINKIGIGPYFKGGKNMKTGRIFWMVVCLALIFSLFLSIPSYAKTAKEINGEANEALTLFYKQVKGGKEFLKAAKGVLVIPNIVKAGVGVGGQYGEGALLVKGKVSGYYSTVQASYGMQAGLQKYGYALFLMSDSAIDWINKSNGWEVGTGPSIVVMDVGKARSMTTTTLHSEIYAFFFSQRGLMAGLGLQGTKITRISK